MKNVRKTMARGLALSVALMACSAFAYGGLASPYLFWDGAVDEDGYADVGILPDYVVGYWFEMGDSTSKIDFHDTTGETFFCNCFDMYIQRDKGFKASAVLGDAEKPHAGMAFSLYGSDEVNSAVDVSAWGGICVEYSSEVPFDLFVLKGENLESGESVYRTAMEASSKEISVCKNWNDFKADDGSAAFGEESVQLADYVGFEFTQKSGDFFIKKMKSVNYQEKDSLGEEGFLKGVLPAAVGVRLEGRNLSFVGGAILQVGVYDFLGRLVKSGMTLSNMDLSDLMAGSYVVRVMGPGVDLTRQIQLR